MEWGEFEDGKGKCFYDLVKGYIGFFVDGELYLVIFNNFLGMEFIILCNMGLYYFMKIEYLVFWFNEFYFVGFVYVFESVGSFMGDDDKVYFFFREWVVEFDCYVE